MDIGALSQLTLLDLHGNALSGALPISMGELGALTELCARRAARACAQCT